MCHLSLDRCKVPNQAEKAKGLQKFLLQKVEDVVLSGSTN